MVAKNYKEYSQSEMLGLTKGVMAILDSWRLPTEQALQVLGLSEKVKARQILNYRKGVKVFPETDDLMVRIDHIIGIVDALRTTFPMSKTMRNMWLHKPHKRFKQSPISIILDETSPEGLLKVRMEVDCAYGYQVADATRPA